jgi:aminoglycoside phosphotransferase (APT) family kinase protein
VSDAAAGAAPPGLAYAEDAAAPVRAGEALDADALAAYLGDAVPGWFGVVPAELAVEQFGGGFSNLTYLLRAPGRPDAVLRRPPRGVAGGSAHDMAREYRLLAALHPVYGRVPRPLALCDDASVLGAPFYVMERVRGVILRGRPGDPVPDAPTLARLAERFVAELAALHALDWRTAGMGALGRPEGYVARQVTGWTKRWHAAQTGPVPAVDATAAWLAAHQPSEPPDAAARATLLHNDFKYDNFVLDPAALAGGVPTVRAVLDWEMATLGDPLMDLGTSLAYWLASSDPPALRALGLGLSAAPGSPTRAELVAAYGRTTGRDVGDALWYYVYGVFKLAVVAQQIYARYVAGHTRDARFAALGAVVEALGHQAHRAVALGRLDDLA